MHEDYEMCSGDPLSYWVSRLMDAKN